LGPLATRASERSSGWSRVIIRPADGESLASVASLVQQHGGAVARQLPRVKASVSWMPNGALQALAEHSAVARISLDRPVYPTMERTGATIGATAVRQQLGFDGSGVGVAVIDSGVTPWHDDLSTSSGGQRVAAFVDLVNGQTARYDDYGHGTHVAGIIAGNGYDSSGARTGIAPNASLIAIKALDSTGGGSISDVIAAFDYVLANKNTYNIRVVNVSLSAGVYESFTTDPLTLAAKDLVDAGIVVVAAAGNIGRDSEGNTIYGGITAPGNAPWVLTVGASSHMGTVSRSDDTVAYFSSRGPTAVDVTAKPDLVAPGVGIESITDPASALYASKAQYLLAERSPPRICRTSV
jgi:serine protease AprX